VALLRDPLRGAPAAALDGRYFWLFELRVFAYRPSGRTQGREMAGCGVRPGSGPG